MEDYQLNEKREKLIVLIYIPTMLFALYLLLQTIYVASGGYTKELTVPQAVTATEDVITDSESESENMNTK